MLKFANGTFGKVIAVRLLPGTDLLGGMEEACRKAGISNGVILSAIGSLDGARFFSLTEQPTKTGYGYRETIPLVGPIELTAASGIVCHDDEGVTNLHVHVCLCDQQGIAHGGHLIEGTKVLLTADVIIGEITGIDMCRKYDEDMEVLLFDPRQA